MNDIISGFIDDELELDDKIGFVTKIHEDVTFRNESLELLHQEKLIRSEVVNHVPAIKLKVRKKMLFPILRPLSVLTTALAAAIIIFFLFNPFRESSPISHRFVIYRPDVSQAEITGTFTGWSRVPMKQAGTSGYWDLTVELPMGEHQFTYILNGKQKFADPTILSREQDDFGGENSIILVESKI